MQHRVPATRAARTAACTVTTSAGLPAAATLAASYVKHHPADRFVVLLIDRVGVAPELIDGYTIVSADWLDLDQDHYLTMAASFDADDLLEIARPLLLRQLLARVDVAVYLDPDCYVFGNLAYETVGAIEHDIVITPRMLAPIPPDGCEPDARTAVAEGAHFTGFLAVSSSALPFLYNWQEHLLGGGQVADTAISINHFDHVRSLFRHRVATSPKLATAYWNLHEREFDEETVLMSFRGFDPERPWLLSSFCVDRPRHLLSAEPRIAAACAEYRAVLCASRSRSTAAPTHDFKRMPDGTEITAAMRFAYRTECSALYSAQAPSPALNLDDLPSHPFGDDEGRGYRAWLSAPRGHTERSIGISRLASAVWDHDPGLQARFPRLLGSDSGRFLKWCASEGRQAIPPWAMPEQSSRPERPVDTFGVNVGGYLTAELGLGEMGRIVHRAVTYAGIPTSATVEEQSLQPYCRTALGAPDSVARPRFPLSILAVNSDQTPRLLASHPELGYERYRIGVWAWELEDLPIWMHQGFPHVDEIWTLSEFCRRAITPHSPVPVKTIPMPVAVPETSRSFRSSAGDPISFLFCFDFNSTGQRKNPWGAVHAFKKAFPARGNARLTIKATNGHLHRAAVERLLYAIDGDHRISLLQTYLSLDELDSLYASSDVYLSLHRSEGFGLTVAEAMARAMPVVATDYSSTTEFFDSRTGWPVTYSLVPVGVGWSPYQAEALWAEPDLDDAATAMRFIADNPATARLRGEAAREHIRQTRSLDSAAAWVEQELHEAYEIWRQRRSSAGRTDRTPPRQRRSPRSRRPEQLAQSVLRGLPARLRGSATARSRAGS